jgi:hypothetical protein
MFCGASGASECAGGEREIETRYVTVPALPPTRRSHSTSFAAATHTLRPAG